MKLRASGHTRSDETCSYDVYDYKAKTVGEFVNEVLAERKNEWGSFEFIRKEGCKIDNWVIPPEFKRYEYKHGKLIDEMPQELLDKPFKTVWGNGGWSCMDYTFDLRWNDKTDIEGVVTFATDNPIGVYDGDASPCEDAETSAKRWHDKFQRLRKFTEDTLRDLIYTETRYGNKDLAFQFFCDKIDEIVNDK